MCEQAVTPALFDRHGVARVPNATEGGKPVYRYETNCYRCGGAGKSDKWARTGYTCYQCGGTCKGPMRSAKLYTAEKLAQLNAAAAKRNAIKEAQRQEKAAAIAAEREARRAAFLADNAELLGKLRTLEGDFWEKLYADMIERATSPSVRQVEIIEAELARRARQAASQFVGTSGERVRLTLTTEKVIDITPPNSRFGRRFMFLARDAAGNRIIYRGNGDFPNEGESATLMATVSEHAEYKGEKQTIIQRPKVQAPAQAAS